MTVGSPHGHAAHRWRRERANRGVFFRGAVHSNCEKRRTTEHLQRENGTSGLMAGRMWVVITAAFDGAGESNYYDGSVFPGIQS